MARKSYAQDWLRCQGRSGSADAVFQSIFRQFGSAVDAQPAANRIHPTAKPGRVDRASVAQQQQGWRRGIRNCGHRLQTCALLLRIRSFGDLHQVAAADPLSEGRLHLLPRRRGVSIRGLSGFVHRQIVVCSCEEPAGDSAHARFGPRNLLQQQHLGLQENVGDTRFSYRSFKSFSTMARALDTFSGSHP